MGHPALILRPYGLFVRGRLELGLEVELDSLGRVLEVRSHTGVPEPYVLSPAFVNSHSHLEYRGLQDQIKASSYWPWIRELTQRKAAETQAEVAAACHLAAQENRRTGVAALGEHSDRPFAGQAMAEFGLKGEIFQEVITFFERENRAQKLASVEANAEKNRAHFTGPVRLSPHAYHTVDRETLADIGASGQPFSIHVAETSMESEFTREGSGLIAEFCALNNMDFEPTGLGIVPTLAELGLVRPGAQFVHCCDLEEGDVELLARSGVSVAHCPRSNIRLGCPPAPVRELLDAGIRVGLGMDSAASSGPIDMFAEMRAALQISEERGRPLSPEQVWDLATTMGAGTLASLSTDSWAIEPGSSLPLVKLHVAGAVTTEDVLEQAKPGVVEWATPDVGP